MILPLPWGFIDHGGWKKSRDPVAEKQSDRLTDMEFGYYLRYNNFSLREQLIHGLS
jgi:hypothetical protein